MQQTMDQYRSEWNTQAITSALSKNWRKWLPVLAVGTAAGVAARYLMDPVKGADRRSAIRTKGMALRDGAMDYSGRAIGGLRSRGEGLFSRITRGEGGEVLDLVKTELGRNADHLNTLKSTFKDGILTLSGPIMASDVAGLLSRVRGIPGIKKVVNEMQDHEGQDHEMVADLH